MQKHPWSGVSHDRFDLQLHVWTIAVNNTFSARAFLVLERTFIKTEKSVFLELFALGAEFTMSFMMVFAVNVNHVSDGFLLPYHPLMRWVRWLWLHFKSLESS